jgi:ubiquinone/menaquinone biosynthesis C-methylase UbiE
MTARESDSYVHALRFRWLTPLYDGVVAATTRERTFRAAVLEQAGLRPGQRVLDLGCGTGTLAIEMASRCPGLQIFGLDGDPEVLARAERKAVRAGVEITWQHGLATRLPFPDSSFDRAVSTLFFHHLATEDKVSAARELHRVLRPGGQLHVADWGPPTGHLQRLLFLPVQWLDGFANTTPQLAGGLTDAFRQAGFEGVQVTCRIPTPLGTMALHRADRA